MAFLCVLVMTGAVTGAAAVRFRSSHARVAQAAPVSSISQQASGEILRNEDVLRMGQARLPSAVVKQLIQSRPHDFRIDSASLVALKTGGVPDDVILTVVEAALGEPAPVQVRPRRSGDLTVGLVSLHTTP